MSYEDPFASAPADPEPQAPAQEAPAQAPAAAPAATAPARPAPTGEGKLVVTLKGGRDFDAPWIVIHANDAADASSQLTSELMDLMSRVQNAAKHFASLGGGASAPAGGGQPRQSNAPAAAQAAPNGEKRFCSHGEMEFKSGISKAGKPYKLFSCTAPRDQQCDAQFLR